MLPPVVVFVSSLLIFLLSELYYSHVGLHKLPCGQTSVTSCPSSKKHVICWTNPQLKVSGSTVHQTDLKTVHWPPYLNQYRAWSMTLEQHRAVSNPSICAEHRHCWDEWLIRIKEPSWDLKSCVNQRVWTGEFTGYKRGMMSCVW